MSRREEVADHSRRLHARGWVANHDGNVTVRDGANFLVTPTATSKAMVTAASLLTVDAKGERVAGTGKPFSEIGLHLTVYANRPDVQAVVHAHPPAATAIACTGSKLLERPFIAEAVVSLGASIPTVPFATPGADACSALAPFVNGYDAVLLGNHGVLAWGVDLEQAYLRLELVEHLAKIALEAERAGGVRPLPESALAGLLTARAKAGLARPNAPSGPKPVVACAPAPHSDVETISPGRRPDAAELARIIREELARVMK
jgi:L-fuculose-phosphate aldolase